SGIRSFTTSPIIFTDVRTARSYLSFLGSEPVTYVLVKVAPGVDVAAVRARTYWSTRTGVGASFFTTAVLGIIVGLVVVGQILYSGTLQYIREYGTLKAMGAKNSAIVKVILSQAMISAAL